MERFKRWFNRLFRLPPLGTLLVAVTGFGLVICALAMKLERTPLAYAAYPLSAYALVAVCAGMPELVRALRRGVNESAAMRKLLSIPLGARYVQDELFRAEVGQYRSLFVNLLFAAVKLSAGIAFRSRWFLTLGFYYLLLALMRALLFRRMAVADIGKDIPNELRRCRLCGIALLLMTQALTVMVALMVVENESYHYPGILIYIMALYAFYAVVAAIYKLVRIRYRGSPVLYASKALNLVAALTSMLALETALLDRFGQDEAFRRVNVAITGTVVCLFALTAAVTMLARSTRGLRRSQAPLAEEEAAS